MIQCTHPMSDNHLICMYVKCSLILQNITLLIVCPQATLERGVKVLEHTKEVELGIFESETVTMAMGLLTAVMGGASKVATTESQHSFQSLNNH